MKCEVEKDTDIEFQEVQAEIKAIKDVHTKKFGDKIVAELYCDDLGDFSIFLNNYSVEKLVSAFGKNDDKWIGKLVDLKQEKDLQFDNDMIVTYPVV